MPDISKLSLNNVEYDIKDSASRESLLGKQDKIPSMTYAEWELWKESDSYDPNIMICITDDYSDAQGFLPMTYEQWLAWCESDEYDEDVLVVITDDNSEDLIKDQESDLYHTYSSSKIENLLSEKMNKPIYVEYTLLSTGWVGDEAPYVYSIDGYDGKTVNVHVDGARSTVEQIEAIMNAGIQGSLTGSANKLYAFGEKPTIDLPVALEVF